MSYQITISGHTRNEHNAQIKQIAEEAWQKAAALHAADELRATLSGYSGDQTGSITLMTPAPQVEATQNAEEAAESAAEAPPSAG